MKTSFKKLTSVFLAMLLLLSVFAVTGVSAAETDKAATGDDTVIHVTDNLGWGTMYVHYWGGSSETTWPGNPMNNDGDNGYGSTNFSATVPSDATGYVFNNGNGVQTVDVTDVNVEGYWLDGTQDSQGHYNVRVWGDTGEGGGGESGGGESGGGESGGGEGYNPGPGQGPHTVVLDASAVDTGYVDWRAWTWADGSDGYWVGAEGTTAADITYTGLEDNVVFAYFTAGSNNSWDGKIGQTDDLRVEGSTFTVSSASPGDKGSVVGDWSGGGGGGGGGFVGGSNTVYLDPGSESGSWYVWSYSGGEDGEWISSEDAGDGKLKFSNVSDNCIFVNTSDGAWSGRTGQTESAYTTDGQLFTISGTTDGDDGYGNPIILYTGDWSDYSSGGGGDTPTEPETQATEPETQATEPETTAPATEPETQATEPETTAPATEPETTLPATEPPTTLPDQKGITVATALNGTVVSTQVAEKSIKVTYNMTSPLLLEDGQGTLYYDSTFLKLTDIDLPGITTSLTLNDSLDNMAKFNFTGVNSKTNSGVFDFKNGGVFLTASFDVVEGAAGGTTVNLDIEELDGLEAGEEVVYFTNSTPSASATQVILPSLQKVTVDVAGGEAETTAPATEEETTTAGGEETSANTDSTTPQPTTIAPPITQPATDATIAPTTAPSGPKTTAKKANPIKVKAKTVKVSAKKLKAKKVNIKLSKLFKVTKAQGKVTYKLVKKGVSKKIRKKVSIKSKKLVIKKINLKKGKTYKVKVQIKAKGNSKYKAKTVTKVAKIKIKK